MSKEAIKNALSTVKYPGFSRDIVSFGLVRSVDFENGNAVIGISVTTSDHSVAARIRDDVESALKAVPEVKNVDVNVSISSSKKPEESSSPGRADLPGVMNVIAVASGKGGVGKSTFASNLACSLAKQLSAEG